MAVGHNGHDSAEDRIGDVIAGFRLERVIGRGGMGVVFLARQIKFDRDVALKLIAPEFARDQKLRARFKREAMAAANVSSPYVVPVYDADEAGGELYIAMPFVEGSDLGRVLAAEGTLDLRRAARIIGQVAAALDTAHEDGLVHRDVKPGNILLSSSGSTEVAYLSDFGLLRRLGDNSGYTSNGHWVGTVDYAAPEQLEGRPVDHRADVYSLGCVLYRCVVGAAPFRRESPTATMLAHVNEPPPNPVEVRPSLPVGIADVIAKALAKDPRQRFESAGELARAISAAVEGTLDRSRLTLRDVSGVGLSGFSGSAAMRPTFHDRAMAPAAHRTAETRRQQAPPWRSKYLLGGVAAAVLIAGIAAALLVSGVLDNKAEGKLAAVQDTAQKSVGLAHKTDDFASELGQLSEKVVAQPTPVVATDTRDGAETLRARAEEMRARAEVLREQAETLRVGEGAENNQELQDRIDSLERYIRELQDFQREILKATKGDKNAKDALPDGQRVTKAGHEVLVGVIQTGHHLTENPEVDSSTLVDTTQATTDVGTEPITTDTTPTDTTSTALTYDIAIGDGGIPASIGDFELVDEKGRVSDMEDAFGPASDHQGVAADDCTFVWSDLDMTVRAGTLGGASSDVTCAPEDEYVNNVLIRSPKFDTADGVHVGVTETELTQLVPTASVFEGSVPYSDASIEGAEKTYQLEETENLVGDGGMRPTLLAHVGNGEVVALQVIPQLMGE